MACLALDSALVEPILTTLEHVQLYSVVDISLGRMRRAKKALEDASHPEKRPIDEDGGCTNVLFTIFDQDHGRNAI